MVGFIKVQRRQEALLRGGCGQQEGHTAANIPQFIDGKKIIQFVQRKSGSWGTCAYK